MTRVRVWCCLVRAQKEMSMLEEEANLPIEEVIRRMQAQAEEEGDDDDDEEEAEESDDEEDDDEDDDDEDDEDDEEEEEEESEEDEDEVRRRSHAPRPARACHPIAPPLERLPPRIPLRPAFPALLYR